MTIRFRMSKNCCAKTVVEMAMRSANKHVAILRGLIYCEPCGCAMTHSTVRKNSKKYRYYVCQKAQKQGWDTCPTKSLNAYEIENAVISQFRGIVEDEADFDGVISKIGRQGALQKAKLLSEQSDTRKKLNNLYVNIRSLIGEVGRADTSDSPLADRLVGLHDQVHVLEKRCQMIQEEISTIDQDRVDKDEMKQALTAFSNGWDSLCCTEQGRILKSLIKKICVDGRDGKVTVDFRHQRGLQGGYNPWKGATSAEKENITVSCTFKYRPQGTNESQGVRPKYLGNIPRVSRLMALAIRFDRLVRDGVVEDYAELAQLGHVSRPRITQIMNLLNLSPEIQEEILSLPATISGRDGVCERHLRPICAVSNWEEQRKMWTKLTQIEPFAE